MKVILTGLIGGLLFGFAIGHAAEREKPQKMTYADVRAVVAIVGEAEAERAARAAGASPASIEWAKRCLK